MTIPGAGTRIFSVQFEDVSTASSIPIRKLVTYSNPKDTATKMGVGNDQIWTYKDGVWKKYYYCSKSGANLGWHLDVDNGATVGPLLTEANDADNSVSAGDAFFFQRSNKIDSSVDTELTLAGGVKALSGTKSVPVVGGVATLMCNPWPLPIKVNAFHNNYSDPKDTATKMGVGNDQIWTYKGGAWQKYYYCSKSGTNLGWHQDLDNGSTVGPKIDDTVVINAGEGFFFQRSNKVASDTVVIKGPEYKAE